MGRAKLVLPLAFAALVVARASPAAAKGPLDATAADRVRAYMAATMDALQIPGASVVIVSPAGIEFAEGFGTKGEGRAPTPQTPFQIASLSKELTAIAVMQCIQAGTLRLDATVHSYLGWFGAEGSDTARITVKDLLVVSLGDSYGSGEGNPPYQDTRCDRSSKAASAQAAERLEQSSAHFSVTFIHLACSGAQILDSDAFDGVFGGGILDPYQGQNPVSAPSGTIVPLNSQLDDLKALIGHRQASSCRRGRRSIVPSRRIVSLIRHGRA